MSDVKEKLNKIAEFAKTIYKGDDAHFLLLPLIGRKGVQLQPSSIRICW